MYAHKITGFTGPGDVVWEPAEEPPVGDGVLVDVVAVGVSFADLLQTRGQYQMKVPVPYVPGMDAAGVVRSAAPGSGLSAGQRVAVLASSGCWQQVLSAPASRVLPLPDGMGFEAGVAGCELPDRAVRAGPAGPGDGGRNAAGARRGGRRRDRGHPARRGLGCARSRSPATRRSVSSRCGTGRTTPCWRTAGWRRCGACWGTSGRYRLNLVGSDRMTDSLRSLAPEGRVLVWGFAGGESGGEGEPAAAGEHRGAGGSVP